MVNGKSFFRYDDWTSSSIIRRESFAEYSSKEIHFDKEVVLVDDLLQALLKFDEITIAALLNEAFSIYSTEKVVASIVLRVTDKLLTSKIIMRFQWCNFNMHYHFTNASRDGVSQCLNVFLFTQSYCVRKGCIERIYFQLIYA